MALEYNITDPTAPRVIDQSVYYGGSAVDLISQLDSETQDFLGTPVIDPLPPAKDDASPVPSVQQTMATTSNGNTGIVPPDKTASTTTSTAKPNKKKWLVIAGLVAAVIILK